MDARKIKSALAQYDVLLESVHQALGPTRHALVIAIDGADGVGKSSLASWLAWQLEMPSVHLDQYIIRDGCPLDWRRDDLSNIIASRLRIGRPVIVEGIRVLDALEAAGSPVDYLVWVRGQGGRGLAEQIGDYKARQRPEEKANFTIDGFGV